MKSIAGKLTKSMLSGMLALGLGWGLVGCQSDSKDARYEEGASSVVTVESAGEPQEAAEADGEAIRAANVNSDYANAMPERDRGVPSDFNTEEYAASSESGFIATATQPLSTFSSDVDTASYCNIRRMVNQGYNADDIPSGAVRTEEMINYFKYDYVTPSGDDVFGVTKYMGTCPWNEDTDLLVMGFATAADVPRVNGRNLVFLVDSSGSMNEPYKLPLLKEAFSKLVDELGADDRVSIVTYSGAEEVLLEGASGDAHHEIMKAMRGIQAEGCTNGEAGLAMAYELAERNFIKGGVNRIVLASDGDLNVGMTSESDLNDFVADKRDTGIYLSVLGFGDGNYKDNKMEALADNGNGKYHYIDCAEEAERVFGESLTENLNPLADDVKLQVEFNPSKVKAYRLIGYENRAMEDASFQDEAADAGDVGPNSQFTIAYEIVPVDSDMDIPQAELKYGDGAGSDDSDEWLTCTVRCKPVSGGNAEQQVVVSSTDLSESPGKDWEFAAGVIECAMLLRESAFAGSASWDTSHDLAAHAADDDLREEFSFLVESLSDGARSQGSGRNVGGMMIED